MFAELESTTRAERVDRQLAQAGWTRSSRRVIDEFFLGGDLATREDDDPTAAAQFVDYALVVIEGRPLALVEVKRSSRDALEGERQAADYADLVKIKYGIDPFIFLANGDEIWFLQRSLYPPRKVSGFFTQDDLERLTYIDQFREPPSIAEVTSRIVDRSYQIEAVKAVSERIELGHRKFLLVLATGTGKTRVAIALIDLLRRQKWIQRVLFLANRRELVKQALSAFKEYLPDAPRCWIEGGDIDKAALREAYEQPSASFADFLRHILGQARLPDREAIISRAFDDWVMRHPKLGATQLLFLRTLRHALIQHAEIATLESLRDPPFSSIGDPQQLFEPKDLDEILDLALSLAA